MSSRASQSARTGHAGARVFWTEFPRSPADRGLRRENPVIAKPAPCPDTATTRGFGLRPDGRLTPSINAAAFTGCATPWLMRPPGARPNAHR